MSADDSKIIMDLKDEVKALRKQVRTLCDPRVQLRSRLLSIGDVAFRLQVGRKVVERNVSELRGFKVGGQWRFKKELVELWIDEQVGRV